MSRYFLKKPKSDKEVVVEEEEEASVHAAVPLPFVDPPYSSLPSRVAVWLMV